MHQARAYGSLDCDTLPCSPCSRLDKAYNNLGLEWLFQIEAAPTTSQTATKPPQEALTSMPLAHLVASALLSGPTKAIRSQACSVLKSLWLLESVKALNSNPATAGPAQRAQHAMLKLLLPWVPALSAYPEAASLYLQLLTWILHATPGLANQLESASSSAKKKKPSSKQKTPPAKASSHEAVSSSSSNALSTLTEHTGFSQSAVVLSQLPGIVAALKLQSSVLADHSEGTAYRALQVLNSPGLVWLFVCSIWAMCIMSVCSCLHVKCCVSESS